MTAVLNHMGHTWDVHRDYYRQYSSVIERLDVSKLLLLQDSDRVAEFRKQGLDTIDVAMLHDTDFTGNSDYAHYPLPKHMYLEIVLLNTCVFKKVLFFGCVLNTIKAIAFKVKHV